MACRMGNSVYKSDDFFLKAEFCWLTTAQDGCITPVRSQERTNCCYAFTIVDAIYAKLHLDGHDGVLGSAQELLDHLHKVHIPISAQFEDDKMILTEKGLQNSYKNAFAYVQKKGLSTHAEYSFVGRVQNFRDPAPTTGTKIFIHSYEKIPSKNHSEVIAKLKCQPIIGSLLVNEVFKNWGKNMGVYQGLTPLQMEEQKKAEKNGEKLPFGHHAVTIVGFGVENNDEYYLCKNSYGENWGHKGYIKITRKVVGQFYTVYGPIVKVVNMKKKKT